MKKIIHDQSSKFLDDNYVNEYLLQATTPMQDMSLSASDKRDNLWNKVIADTTRGTFPSTLSMPGLFLESMKTTFETAGDLMPSTKFGKRTKYIHSVGVVSKVAFKANENSSYPGIFKGAE